MSVYLSLLPFDCDTHGTQYSHTVLSCSQDESMYEAIMAIEKKHGKEVPIKFRSYLSREGEIADPHYGTTRTTPYGELLKYVFVGWLLEVKIDPNPDLYVDHAIWAYLKCLPKDKKVALYWH